VSETPLILGETQLALHLDMVRLAIVQWASTTVARLVKLHDPQYTDLLRFLAIGPAGSSGHMVLEYTAGSALSMSEPLKTLLGACDALPTPGPDRALIDEIALADRVLDQLASALPLDIR
jgi:Aromatic amino acid lyase